MFYIYWYCHYRHNGTSSIKIICGITFLTKLRYISTKLYDVTKQKDVKEIKAFLKIRFRYLIFFCLYSWDIFLIYKNQNVYTQNRKYCIITYVLWANFWFYYVTNQQMHMNEIYFIQSCITIRRHVSVASAAIFMGQPSLGCLTKTQTM